MSSLRLLAHDAVAPSRNRNFTSFPQCTLVSERRTTDAGPPVGGSASCQLNIYLMCVLYFGHLWIIPATAVVQEMRRVIQGSEGSWFDSQCRVQVFLSKMLNRCHRSENVLGMWVCEVLIMVLCVLVSSWCVGHVNPQQGEQFRHWPKLKLDKVHWSHKHISQSISSICLQWQTSVFFFLFVIQ